MPKTKRTHRQHNRAGCPHALTFSCHEHRRYLARTVACTFVAEAIRRTQSLGTFDLWAYVIMPSHVHMLLYPLNQSFDAVTISRLIKGSMSRRYSDYLQRNIPQRKQAMCVMFRGRLSFRFWMRGGGYVQNPVGRDAVWAATTYIEMNPVKAGLVESPYLWPWSSASCMRPPTKTMPIVNRSCMPR